MTEKTFQTSVQYGTIALGVSVVFNIYVVMHHVEVYREAVRAEAVVQQTAVQEQVLQAVVQDFMVRANTDSNIAAIFSKTKSLAAQSAAANKPHP